MEKLSNHAGHHYLLVQVNKSVDDQACGDCALSSDKSCSCWGHGAALTKWEVGWCLSIKWLYSQSCISVHEVHFTGQSHLPGLLGGFTSPRGWTESSHSWVAELQLESQAFSHLWLFVYSSVHPLISTEINSLPKLLKCKFFSTISSSVEFPLRWHFAFPILLWCCLYLYMEIRALSLCDTNMTYFAVMLSFLLFLF